MVLYETNGGTGTMTFDRKLDKQNNPQKYKKQHINDHKKRMQRFKDNPELHQKYLDWQKKYRETKQLHHKVIPGTKVTVYK